jgi:glycogen operon protein
VHGSEIKDITWLRPDGEEMSEEDWEAGFHRTIGVRLAGEALGEVDDLGQPIVDDTFVLLLNAWWEDLDFRLPPSEEPWGRVLDTFEADPFADGNTRGEGIYLLRGRSLALFSIPRPADTLL